MERGKPVQTLIWFEFYAELPEDEEVGARHQEIIFATFAQTEDLISVARRVCGSGQATMPVSLPGFDSYAKKNCPTI